MHESHFHVSHRRAVNNSLTKQTRLQLSYKSNLHWLRESTRSMSTNTCTAVFLYLARCLKQADIRFERLELTLDPTANHAQLRGIARPPYPDMASTSRNSFAIVSSFSIYGGARCEGEDCVGCFRPRGSSQAQSTSKSFVTVAEDDYHLSVSCVSPFYF